MTELSLSELQAFLHRLITAPNGVAAALQNSPDLSRARLEELIAGDQRLSALERVDIYANMYFYRLLDALKEDFPATLAVIDADNFHNLITAYLLEYPPTEPSIAFAGQHLPTFVRDHPLSERWPFLYDLARLERTLIEVFHDRDVMPLDAERLRALAPERWADVELRTVAALRIVSFGRGVADVVRAVEEKREWRQPKAVASTVLVWRKRNRVFYRELGALEEAALKMVEAGTRFADLCEQIAATLRDADSRSQILELLNRWLDDELLRAT